MHSQAFISEMKEKLLAAKAELTEELKNLNPHTDLGDDDDENAEEINVDEVNQQVAVRIKGDLEKIDAALAKIEAGTYGTDSSGADIPEGRLRALPWADSSV